MTNFKYLLIALLLFNCKSKSLKDPFKDTEKNLKQTVVYLASDELRGRDTGSEGIALAADYLEKKLNQYGVKPYYESYKDNFKVGDVDAFNIVAYVEGSDPKLKDEFIVIGAHYDHIGIGKTEGTDSIANGANDNASGTATILEMARYFGQNKSNKRSLLFAFFSAEEKGLQGSKHLAKRLKDEQVNLYTMLNFEMTGVPFIERDYTAFLTGYDLSNMADIMNKYADQKLIGKSDVSAQYNLFKRSDNYAFYQESKIPSQTVSTCDLTNFDHYHKVGDESDIMNYGHMAKLTSKMIPIIESIANSDTQEIKMNE